MIELDRSQVGIVWYHHTIVCMYHTIARPGHG